VEKNRAKFALINDRELDSRKAFVNEAQESINGECEPIHSVTASFQILMLVSSLPLVTQW
jgi:hypothetical protein